MNILIKGMGMPKNCLECVFYRRTDHVYDYCCISSATPKGYVPNDCPLVPVPPHGRLIDADIMIKKYEPDINRRIYGGNFIFDLEHAPTVIPADKDGET